MKTFARCVLAAAVAGLSLSSAQAETTLRMAHFWPGASGGVIVKSGVRAQAAFLPD